MAEINYQVGTYIKSFRAKIHHPLLANDNNAYIVFDKLLHLVDRRTGSYTSGRFKLAALMNLKPSTTYKVLKRLEKHGMLNIKSNNQFSTIHICNWDKYQLVSSNGVTAKEQPSNTKQEVRSNNKYRDYGSKDKGVFPVNELKESAIRPLPGSSLEKLYEANT